MRLRSIALAALLASVSHATVMEELSLERTLQLAGDVVVGRVVSSESRLESYGRIVTHTSIRVDEWLMGDGAPGDSLLVSHPGGEVDDLGMFVHGMPHFVAGERVLLFLKPLQATGTQTTVGGYQGAYVIEEEEDGSLVAVQKTTHGAKLVGSPRGTALPRRVALGDFSRALAAFQDAP